MKIRKRELVSRPKNIFSQNEYNKSFACFGWSLIKHVFNISFACVPNSFSHCESPNDHAFHFRRHSFYRNWQWRFFSHSLSLALSLFLWLFLCQLWVFVCFFFTLFVLKFTKNTLSSFSELSDVNDRVFVAVHVHAHTQLKWIRMCLVSSHFTNNVKLRLELHTQQFPRLFKLLFFFSFIHLVNTSVCRRQQIKNGATSHTLRLYTFRPLNLASSHRVMKKKIVNT